MSAEKPTPDEVAALLNGLSRAPGGEEAPRKRTSLEIACGGSLMLVQTPMILTLKDESQFHVTDLQAWGYTPFGVLAVGSFDEEAEEADWESRVFAHDVIHNIKFDKERYEALIESIRAEEDEPVEDEAPVADAEGVIEVVAA